MDDNKTEMPARLAGTFPSVMPANWPEVLESRAKARHLGDTSGTSDLLVATAYLLRPLLAPDAAVPGHAKVVPLQWKEDRSRHPHLSGKGVVRVWRGRAIDKHWATAVECDDGMVTLLGITSATRHPTLEVAQAVAQEEFRQHLLSAFVG